MGQNRQRGTVKWFDDSKGFGFIKRNNGQDIFVHYSNIDSDGHRSLQEGDEVEFSVEPSKTKENAVQAVEVRKI